MPADSSTVFTLCASMMAALGGVSTHALALCGMQGVVHAVPRPLEAPTPKMVEDSLPGWEVGGQRAPRAARAQHGEDRINDITQRVCPRPATCSRCRKVQLETLPLGVREAARIDGAHVWQSTELCHAAALPNTLSYFSAT